MKPLTNQTIAITGASSGLGKALVYQAAENGGNVILLARNIEKLQELKSDLAAKYPSQKFWTYQLDVINNQQTESVFCQIHNEGIHIDILINNAGVILKKPLEQTLESEIHNVIDTNTKGVIFCTRAVLGQMKENGKGKIVNIVSNQGKHARPEFSIYTASKFAIHGFTQALQKELVSTNIHVYGIYPAGMKTELFDRAGCDEPGLTSCMDPSEVAKAVIFILTRPEGMYIDSIDISRNY